MLEPFHLNLINSIILFWCYCLINYLDEYWWLLWHYLLLCVVEGPLLSFNMSYICGGQMLQMCEWQQTGGHRGETGRCFLSSDTQVNDLLLCEEREWKRLNMILFVSSPCWNETFRCEQVFAPLTLVGLVLDTEKHLNLNKDRIGSAHIQPLVPPTLFINRWLHKMTALHQRWQITTSLILHTRNNISHFLSQSIGAQSSPSLFWHHGSVQCSGGPVVPVSAGSELTQCQCLNQ